MARDIRIDRILAVHRYLNEEQASAICVSLRKSRRWLYKWVDRFEPDNLLWMENQPPYPKTHPNRTPKEIEKIVTLFRQSLYNKGMFCGAQAIRWEMEDHEVRPLPSIPTINRILVRQGLTHRRTGRYLPKGTRYPGLEAKVPNEVHQADLLGPLYLKGTLRFYNLNVIDLATGRCGLQPLFSCAAQPSYTAFWKIWGRLGLPRHLQVDNDMVFFGSPTYPRGMGPLIRLCLLQGIEPWFIPVKEPWRNGVVEKFNDHYRQKFLERVPMKTKHDLYAQSLRFEHRHNWSYRYTKLNGKTPLQALENMNATLRFPNQHAMPEHPLAKPKAGKYHVTRLIRGNQKMNIFGETFTMPTDLIYEYVQATIDVKEQTIRFFHDNECLEEWPYNLKVCTRC